MPGQFTDNQGEKVLEEVGSLFRDKPVFRRANAHLLFVCGGAIKADSVTMRRSFMTWARSYLSDFSVVVAEHAFPQATEGSSEFINLAKFEKLVADVSDCVVIFPESAGSYAEVGYFSAVNDIRKKVLVVNKNEYQTRDSFVNLGPISTIDERSVLRPAVHLPGSPQPSDFDQLNSRFDRIRSRRRSRRKLDHRGFNQLDYGERLCVLLELIRILRAVTLDGLRRSITAAFGTKRPSDLHMLLSVLVASEFVRHCDEYFVPRSHSKTLLEIEGAEIDTIIARILYYYQQCDPRTFGFAKADFS